MRCDQVEKELPWKLVKLSCLTNNWMFCLTFVIKLRFHAIGMKWMCLVVESFVSDQLENVKSPCATAYVQFLLDYLLMQSMWWAKHAQSYYFINSNEAAAAAAQNRISVWFICDANWQPKKKTQFKIEFTLKQPSDLLKILAYQPVLFGHRNEMPLSKRFIIENAGIYTKLYGFISGNL